MIHLWRDTSAHSGRATETEYTTRQTVSWLYENMAGNRLRVLCLIILYATDALASVWFALVSRDIIDSATAGNRDGLIRSGILLFVIIAIEVLCELIERAMNEYVKTRHRINMQNRMLTHLLRKEHASIANIHSGELLNRMFSDVDVIVGGLVNIVPFGTFYAFRLAGAAGVLIFMAPQFTILFLAAGILMFLVLTFLRGKLKHLHKEMQSSEGRVRAFLQESLSSMLVIRVFGAGQQVLEQENRHQEEYFKARMKRRSASIIANTGFATVFQLGYFLAMIWGCFGIFHGTITYGTLTAMLQLVNQIQSPFNGFSSLISQYYSVLASAERVMELEDLPEEKEEPSINGRQMYDTLDSITYDNVSFSYGRNNVLKDSSFSIPKGSIVSIMGGSGGGKSTLFYLMMGAYKPTSGAIRFHLTDGSSKEPGTETRQMFAYVPQGNYLFSGTLRENVTFWKDIYSEEQIHKALEAACAEEFICTLPQGLDTMLGEKGHGLSEGQMQRVAIARAILSGAPILLLDEATSALDGETEARLLQNIRNLQDRACVIVTHRRAALKICNKKLLLENGKIETSI